MDTMFKSHNTIASLTRQREVDENARIKLRRRAYVNDYLIKRIGLEGELTGHEGCVNTLEWNSRGDILVSSSDDTRIIIWDPFVRKALTTIDTIHEGNIFSARFLPGSNDRLVVTAAADHQIMIHDVETKDLQQLCRCSRSRVKRIETSASMPSIYWSASEDGLVRQTDTRCKHNCGNRVKNVLINLNSHVGNIAETKCLAINPVKTELLAVGANDPYVRLYDRRMIKVITELKSIKWFRKQVGSTTETYGEHFIELNSRKEPWVTDDNIPDGCVQYFIPGHLRSRLLNRRYKYVAVTYVSFSPNGRELLVNLGSEQVYLFDINKKHLPRYFKVPSVYRGQDIKPPPPKISYKNGYKMEQDKEESEMEESESEIGPQEKSEKSSKAEEQPLPKDIAKLKEKANEYFKANNFIQAVKMYNIAISKYNDSAVLYGNRAAALMKRNWKGDMYVALRDCYKALQIDPYYVKAFFRFTRCLHELHMYLEAKDCLETLMEKFPKHANDKACKALFKDVMAGMKKKHAGRSSHAGYWLFRPSLLLKVPRSELQVSVNEKVWQAKALDFENRYCGHCNTTTDIKEANFFGGNGQYIVAGSDEGNFFFWDRKTENIVHALRGDSSIVNCLQPHPFTCLLATSGIDNVVRLWSPRREEEWENKEDIGNYDAAAEANQKRMQADPVGFIIRTESPEENVAYTCRTS